MLAWIVFYPPAGQARDARALVRLVVPAAAGALIMPAIAILWLWRLDLLHDARVAVVDFNRFYVAQGFSAGQYAVDLSKAVWMRIKSDPLWLAGAVAAFAAIWDLLRRRSLPPLAGLAVLWGAAATLVIVVNGARLFNTYFIQPLAPLALLAAWLLVEAARESRPRRIVAAATMALMAVPAGDARISGAGVRLGAGRRRRAPRPDRSRLVPRTVRRLRQRPRAIRRGPTRSCRRTFTITPAPTSAFFSSGSTARACTSAPIG